MSIIRNGKKIAGLYKATEVEHASEEHAGIIEIASTEEVTEGTSNSKAITPSKLKGQIENLATKEELNNKQDTLIAGENITIEDNIISSIGGGKEEVFIEEEQPTAEGWKLWVDLDAIPTDKSEVIVSTDEPTGDKWKIWIDEDEQEEEYATKEYVDEMIGNIESILSEV